jgi:hypothetical protein
METRQLSPSQGQAVEPPIPSVFPGPGWVGAVLGSLITASNERWFDHHALLRWADDGGRWAGESNCMLHEARSLWTRVSLAGDLRGVRVSRDLFKDDVALKAKTVEVPDQFRVKRFETRPVSTTEQIAASKRKWGLNPDR